MYGQYIVPDAKEFMSLGVGQPAPYILDTANKFISYPIEDYNVLQYGMKNGFEDYRKLVCKLMQTFTNPNPNPNPNPNDTICHINPNNIYMTNGITQAIFMLGSLLKKHKFKNVYVENLTYFIIINIFKDLDFEIKSFDIGNIEELRKKLRNETEPSLIYIIPFCNNPTGKTLSHKSQIDDILGITQEFNVLILSDETYQFLHYSNYYLKSNPIDPKPLAIYSNKIISLGTFSKILVPGIRLGWIYSQDNILINEHKINIFQWLDDTGFMDSGGSVNPAIAYMVVKNLTFKFDMYKKFLFGVIQDLEKKSNLILNVLNKYPEYFEPIIPDGGYFIFVKSKKMTSLQLLELAKKCGFNFHCGNKFTILDNQHETFRLSVSYYSLLDFETYFESRFDNLVKLIDEQLDKSLSDIPKSNIPAFDADLFGYGKLGKLIAGELERSNIKYKQITRELNLTHINILNFKSHVIIDVSSPEGTIRLLDAFYEKMILPKLIIGTTGHTEEQMEKIKNYAKCAPVFYCSNFSQGIQGLINVIHGLSFIPNSITIREIHHKEKKDAPSGTAKLLKTHLEMKYPEIDNDIDSIRTGDEVGTHIIKFDMGGETIELTHRALDRKIFATGCISLLDKILTSSNGFYLNNF